MEAVFGEETIETFRAPLKDREAVKGTMNFCRSRSDLMRKETLATWSGENGMEPFDGEPDDPIVLRFRANARMCALSIAYVLRSPRSALVILRGRQLMGGAESGTVPDVALAKNQAVPGECCPILRIRWASPESEPQEPPGSSCCWHCGVLYGELPAQSLSRQFPSNREASQVKGP